MLFACCFAVVVFPQPFGPVIKVAPKTLNFSFNCSSAILFLYFIIFTSAYIIYVAIQNSSDLRYFILVICVILFEWFVNNYFFDFNQYKNYVIGSYISRLLSFVFNAPCFFNLIFFRFTINKVSILLIYIEKNIKFLHKGAKALVHHTQSEKNEITFWMHMGGTPWDSSYQVPLWKKILASWSFRDDAGRTSRFYNSMQWRLFYTYRTCGVYGQGWLFYNTAYDALCANICTAIRAETRTGICHAQNQSYKEIEPNHPRIKCGLSGYRGTSQNGFSD